MKASNLCAVAFVVLCCLAWPEQANAQYCGNGVAYGTSIITYDDPTHGVYAYSATELDYCAGLYYDPYVEGYLYEGSLTEFLRDAVDSDYGYGYSNVYPAEALTSARAKPLTRYIIKTYHYVVAYYYQNACFASGCGFYWYDPWGYYFSSGDYGGGYNFWGYYNPGYYYYRQFLYLGSTSTELRTPYFCTGTIEDTGTRYFTANGAPEGSFCEPPPQEYNLRVSGRPGVALSNGTAPSGGLPYVNTVNITATGSPGGGTYTWSTTSTKVSLSNTNSATVTVKAVSKSATKNDVVLKVVYRAPDGTPIEGLWELTVQQPTQMRFDAVTQNMANNECSTQGSEEYLPGSSGWEKSVRWRVMDHLGNQMDAGELPITSTTNPYAGQGAGRFSGMTPADRYTTTNNGFWTHRYHWCSTKCGRNEPDRVRAYQRYVVNGFTLPDIQLAYECRKITVQGDGTDQTPLQPRRRTVAQFTQDAWLGALGVDTTDGERQYWTDRLTAAQAQGQSQLMTEARAFLRALFYSAEYINRGRSDEDYVSDLYWAYLQRAPDEGGHAAWLGVLRDHNAQGLNGRENVLQGFEFSSEFANLLASLESGQTGSTCDPFQEQNCYNQGGSWDSSSCFCFLPQEPTPDPCYNGSYYYCY